MPVYRSAPVFRRFRRLPDDLRGLARLATDATVGTADLAEALHAQIALRPARTDRKRGIAGLVYRSVRRIARIAGWGADATLLPLARLVRDAHDAPSSRRREALLAVLNGVVGDGLAATDNPLAIDMRLRRDGVALDLAPDALARAIPAATPHVLVLVHGLCMNDLEWTTAAGHDHGAALERDAGLTALYLHYNTGLHISTNGRAFADVLERLVGAWPVPVETLSVLCHSMGGLVTRSAAHVAGEAGMAWPRLLTRIVFLGTPHHGSPLERGGNRLDRLFLKTRFSAPFARLGHLRSAGITDLRHGSLLDEDWRWRDRFAARPDTRRAVPLPPGVEAFAVAASLPRRRRRAGRRAGDVLDRTLGDGLVPLASALGQHADAALALAFDADRQHVAHGVHHFGLLGPGVYPTLRRWLAPAGGPDVAA